MDGSVFVGESGFTNEVFGKGDTTRRILERLALRADYPVEKLHVGGACAKKIITSPKPGPPGGYSIQVTLRARGSTYLPCAEHGEPRGKCCRNVGVEVSSLLTSQGRWRRPP